MDDQETPILKALGIAAQYGQTDGAHHKAWVIDQIVRALLECPMVTRSTTDYRGEPYEYETQGESEMYTDWIREYQAGEDGPDTYEWDIGIAP